MRFKKLKKWISSFPSSFKTINKLFYLTLGYWSVVLFLFSFYFLNKLYFERSGLCISQLLSILSFSLLLTSILMPFISALYYMFFPIPVINLHFYPVDEDVQNVEITFEGLRLFKSKETRSEILLKFTWVKGNFYDFEELQESLALMYPPFVNPYMIFFLWFPEILLFVLSLYLLSSSMLFTIAIIAGLFVFYKKIKKIEEVVERKSVFIYKLSEHSFTNIYLKPYVERRIKEITSSAREGSFIPKMLAIMKIYLPFFT